MGREAHTSAGNGIERSDFAGNAVKNLFYILFEYAGEYFLYTQIIHAHEP